MIGPSSCQTSVLRIELFCPLPWKSFNPQRETLKQQLRDGFQQIPLNWSELFFRQAERLREFCSNCQEENNTCRYKEGQRMAVSACEILCLTFPRRQKNVPSKTPKNEDFPRGIRGLKMGTKWSSNILQHWHL